MGRGVEIRQPLAAFDHGHRRRDKTRDVRQLLLGKTQLFASLPQPGGKALLQVARHILKLVFCRTLQVQPRSSRGHVNLLSLLVVQVGPVKAEPQLCPGVYLILAWEDSLPTVHPSTCLPSRAGSLRQPAITQPTIQL